ncbi:MAG TPA: LolA-related protein [Burkholderiales bacterium]|nr:LolA-related protein [Burkholderiales bacterium]
MTSGTKNIAKAAIALFAAIALRATASPEAIDAQGLMTMLASVESATASYVETRYSPLLKSPLVSRGTLSYRRPDRIEEHVESPRDERFVLQGDRLTIEDTSGNRSVTVNAGSAGGIAALIEGVRATRAGDLAALERDFHVAASGTQERWQLRLQPRTPALTKYVRGITISGSRARIQTIEVLEASGDRTVMEVRESLR